MATNKQSTGDAPQRAKASMDAGTSIDMWLRQNPRATPDECVAEYVRRYVHALEVTKDKE